MTLWPTGVHWMVTTLNELVAITVIGGLMAMGAVAIVTVGFLWILFCGGFRHDTQTPTDGRGE